MNVLREMTKMLLTHYMAGRQSVMLRGSPGGGKSSYVRDTLLKALSLMLGEPVGLVIWTLSAQDAVDFKGFLLVQREALADGPFKGQKAAVFSVPALAQAVYAEMQRTGAKTVIVFLDEFGQADHMVGKASASIILEGVCGDVPLPGDPWIICATNRVEDMSGVNASLRFVDNRLAIYDDVNTDALGYQTWAMENMVHPCTLAFADINPGVAFTTSVPRGSEQFCTARSLTELDKWLQHWGGGYGNHDVPLPLDNKAVKAMHAFIGESAADQYKAVIQYYDKVPGWKEIISNPTGARIPTKLDEQYVVMSNVLTSMRHDTVEPAFKYVTRLPKDMHLPVAIKIDKLSADGDVESPTYAKWFTEHSDLIIAASGM